jgi:hypothetical protein
MENSLLLSAAGLLSGLVSFAVEIAMLVVALGPVRKHRPEASALLASSAGLQLLTTMLYYPATIILPRTLAIASYGMIFALIGLCTTLLRGTAAALLIVGILRLVTPVNRDPTRYG